MNLYLIWQNTNSDYDTYDGAVVAAETEEDARDMHPRNGEKIDWNSSSPEFHYDLGDWVRKREDVNVKLIGKAVEGAKAGIELHSFNAG